jgi:uncharacterized protein (TIGR00661 family)
VVVSRILFSALDWGLGHTTRCIPLLKELAQYHELYVGVNEVQKSILIAEIPSVTFLDLNGYDIKYHGKFLLWGLCKQLPKIIKSIRLEKKWVKKTCHKLKIDLIISDNRFGFFHAHIPNIYITHQLRLASPRGFKKLEFLGVWLHKRIWNKFDQVWVPDFPTFTNSLSLKLGHISGHKKIHFIGPQSRFKNFHTTKTKDIDLCIVLSGPEPQRSKLETLLLPLFKEKLTIVLIRGLPQNLDTNTNIGTSKVYNHLPTEELAKTLSRSKRVLCRGGYTTLMDLYFLKMPALLIPTPGQTEQEYLAQNLNGQSGFKSFVQSSPELIIEIKKALYQPEPYEVTEQSFTYPSLSQKVSKLL